MRATPTRVTLVLLAVGAMALAGCQTDRSAPVQPAAGSVAPPAPADSASLPAPAGSDAAPVGTDAGAGVAAVDGADNGVAALSGAAILKRAKAALVKAKSFRVKGTTTEDGQKINFDVRVSSGDFIGTMNFGAARVDILRVGRKQFIRPNEQFLALSSDAAQGKAIAQVLKGRWMVVAPGDQSSKELLNIGSVDELLKPVGALSKGGRKVIAGIPAIGLKDSGDAGSLLYIATTGAPYPLQISGKAGESTVLSGFGAKVSGIKVPAANQVVDLSQTAG